MCRCPGQMWALKKDVEGKIKAEKIEGESTGDGDGMEGRRMRETKGQRERERVEERERETERERVGEREKERQRQRVRERDKGTETERVRERETEKV